MCQSRAGNLTFTAVCAVGYAGFLLSVVALVILPWTPNTTTTALAAATRPNGRTLAPRSPTRSSSTDTAYSSLSTSSASTASSLAATASSFPSPSQAPTPARTRMTKSNEVVGSVPRTLHAHDRLPPASQRLPQIHNGSSSSSSSTYPSSQAAHSADLLQASIAEQPVLLKSAAYSRTDLPASGSPKRSTLCPLKASSERRSRAHTAANVSSTHDVDCSDLQRVLAGQAPASSRTSFESIRSALHLPKRHSSAPHAPPSSSSRDKSGQDAEFQASAITSDVDSCSDGRPQGHREVSPDLSEASTSCSAHPQKLRLARRLSRRLSSFSTSSSSPSICPQTTRAASPVPSLSLSIPEKPIRESAHLRLSSPVSSRASSFVLVEQEGLSSAPFRRSTSSRSESSAPPNTTSPTSPSSPAKASLSSALRSAFRSSSKREKPSTSNRPTARRALTEFGAFPSDAELLRSPTDKRLAFPSSHQANTQGYVTMDRHATMSLVRKEQERLYYQERAVAARDAGIASTPSRSSSSRERRAVSLDCMDTSVRPIPSSNNSAGRETPSLDLSGKTSLTMQSHFTHL